MIVCSEIMFAKGLSNIFDESHLNFKSQVERFDSRLFSYKCTIVYTYQVVMLVEPLKALKDPVVAL